MKKNLLAIVQDMLSAIDSENVSDVGDTEEAGMCVNIANRAFEEMAQQHRWRHFRKYTQLNTTANLNEMVPPTGVIAIDPDNVYYAGNPVFYVAPDDFLYMTLNRTGSNVQVINNISIYNDRNPSWWTSDDDQTIRFDSIPSATNGLAGSSSMCIAWVAPTQPLTDNTSTFQFPSQAFPTLVKLCISKALGELKGDSAEAKATLREYKSGMSSLARNARMVDKLTDVRKSLTARPTRTLVTPRIQNPTSP